MYPEQQRYWVSLLNLQRTWSDDDAALGFLPPKYRDFVSTAEWPRRRALVYLLNNLELIRESWRRVEAGEALDWPSLNAGLEGLKLHLHPWQSLGEVLAAGRAKADLGGRLETLQVTTEAAGLNPGTRYIRATIERAIFYFAQYLDERLSDPAYPRASPGRWQVAPKEDQSGDLVLLRVEGAVT